MTLIKRLCNQGRIVGAVYKDGVWRIPEDAARVERTVLEYTEEAELPELAKKLQNQKKKRDFHGLYDFVVTDLTYSSSRMASCRLTRQQVETIFRKGKVRESFEPMKVSDVIEVLNHMTALQTHLDTLQPNYPDNAQSILEVLFDAYNESDGFDNAAIKADFEDLYRLMNGKPLKEIDEIKRAGTPFAFHLKAVAASVVSFAQQGLWDYAET